MSFAGKWVELEITSLSEINQFHKGKYNMFSLLFVEAMKKQNKTTKVIQSKRGTPREVEGK
jgi:hypothetical protein